MGRARENQQTQPANWAEWLLDLGKRVNKEIRCGAGIEEVSQRFQNSLDTCMLSLVFYRTCDVIKLRALIEDWSRERLVLELGGIYSTIPAKEKAGLS